MNHRLTAVVVAVALALLSGCGGDGPKRSNAGNGSDNAAPGSGVPSFTTTASEIPPPRTCDGYVALTFDDGPSDFSLELIRLLERRHVPAVFFNLGSNVRGHEDVLTAEFGNPAFQIGNHSWDHPDLRRLSMAAVTEQIQDTNTALGTFGRVHFFRPPYGSYTEEIADVARDDGLVLSLWTVDSKDFETHSVEQIVEQSKGMEDGGNVLLHDRSSDLTIRALPLIIDHYHRRGMCFGLLGVRPNMSPLSPQESPGLWFYTRAVAPSEALK